MCARVFNFASEQFVVYSRLNKKNNIITWWWVGWGWVWVWVVGHFNKRLYTSKRTEQNAGPVTGFVQ